MSSTGGGLIILANDERVWTSPDGDTTLTLHNNTNTNKTITLEEVQSLASQYGPGDIGLNWDGTSWSVA